MEKSCVKHNVKKTDYNYINLRDAIWESGLNNTELAKRIGVDKSRVSDWCNGKGFPKEKNLQKLLSVLNEIKKKKHEIPYTISYLRGDTNCKILDNETIYNRVYLKDEAIDTLEKIGTTETKQNKNALIPNTNPLTYIDTFNYVISKKELWETLYTEIEKALKDNLKETKAKYTNDTTTKEIHEFIESLNVPMSNQLYDTIKTILNDYIKELLRYYFPNE